MYHVSRTGFTLIELLVVISIIGVLSSVLLASLSDARNAALYTRARSDIKQIGDLATIARIQSGQSMLQITGSFCSEFACRDRGSIQNLPRTDPCWVAYTNAIAALNAAAGGLYAIRTPMADPWGAPYLINENEDEFHSPSGSACHEDNILSAGPDGVYYNEDDIVYSIPVMNCRPSLPSHAPRQNWF